MLGFNRTRVRLKPGRMLSGMRYDDGFNRTRVRLKPVEDATRVPVDALQPHEGSSETLIPVVLLFPHLQLQPHEGSSETVAGRMFPYWSVSLQPHEGSSETRV